MKSDAQLHYVNSLVWLKGLKAMINSMTGFGESQGQLDGVTYAVEVKAINNRYFKATIKLPDSVAFLEADIEKLLRENLSRGTVSYVLRLKNISANVLFEIDQKALQTYMDRLSRIMSPADTQCRIDVAGLLTLPGILVPVLPDAKTAERIRKVVLGITQEAVNQLKQMRQAEGRALAADLESHCKAIRQNLERIRARSATVLEYYHKKLEKRVNELLMSAKLKLDEETLAREVAIFADRSDISEEVARLDSHLQQFVETCQRRPASPLQNESLPVIGNTGRRLDFISQEMLREANTIASKASDAEIARCVVDIKCRIDRIKEQVQNAE